MKPDIYIHVGLHKTGTSSIQAALYQSRRKLERHDINYLGIAENHSTTLYPLFCDAPHQYYANRRDGIDTEAKAARKNATTARALRRSLETNRFSRFVISGEALSVLSLAGVVRLKQALEPYAERMRVIVYLREPYSYITSFFQLRMRHGASYDQVLANPPLPKYRLRLSRFIEVFGRDAVDIRIFGPAHFVDGDLIADFLAAIQAPPGLAKEIPARRVNEALSLEAAWLLNEVNKRYPESPGERPNSARAPELLRLLAAIPGQKFALPAEVYAAVAPAVDRELRWLRRLLGENPFTQPPPTVPSVPRWNDETIATLAVLINELGRRGNDWRYHWQKTRTALTELTRQTALAFRRDHDAIS